MSGQLELRLPRPDGSLTPYQAGTVEPIAALAGPPPSSRVAFAAAHVVADPLADIDPTAQVAVDWDATLGFRRHLWAVGLGVAEAMDTAQRGMGIDWSTTAELIRRSCAEAEAVGGRIACGAATDQLTAARTDIDRIRGAYEEQIELIEDAGGQVVIMASRTLAASTQSADDYAKVYADLLVQVRRPVILHWLGEPFDPALRGYWGSVDPSGAADTLLAIIADHRDVVDGIKVSLLDADFEVALRRRLPPGVRMYTGDDFNYPALVRGDDHGYSDALVGIFDGIAPVAAAALGALDDGDTDRYEQLLAPTLPFSRHVFGAPTYYYKTGLVFLAYLNGHQDHFRMVGGLESARSVVHLARLFELADQARLLVQPDLAAQRMRAVLSLAGVDA